jgi:predicted permease
MLNDLRQALRLFSRAPGFAAAAVVSIGLAIGANAAIFSLADALFLRPLDVPDPAGLVTLGTRPWRDDGRHSLPDYTDFRIANQSFASLAALRTVRAGISRKIGSPTDLRIGFAVTSNFLATFGVRPKAGRDFSDAEGQVAGRDAVVLLGYDYWVRAFDKDPSIVGRTVRLNGRPFDVIGIAPDSFTHIFDLARPAFFVPITMAHVLDDEPTDAQITDRDQRLFTVKGRLRPGVSIEAASHEATVIFRRLAAAHPDTNRAVDGIVLSELSSRVAGDPNSPRLIALLGLLTIVLLCIACSNVTNLVLGRASTRAREIGVRLAIGAGRWRLVRLLLAESLMLALAGGALGVLVAAGGIELLRAFAPSSGLDVPTPLLIELNVRGLLVTFAIAGGSALLFGLAPAMRAGRTDVLTALKPGAGDHGRGRMIGRSTLVVVQIAGSLVLLVAATQIARGLSLAVTLDPGFSTDRRLTLRLDPRLAGYSSDRTEQFYRELTAAVGAVPGVRSVALSSSLPLSAGFNPIAVAPEGFTFPPGQTSATIVSASVDPAYFATLGVRLVRGRGFRDTDRADGPWVAIVDETFAARYLGESPIGRRLRFVERGNRTAEVVGISAASRHNSVFMPSQPFIYLPIAQHPASSVTLIAHTVGEPTALADPLRGAVEAIDPDVPVYRIESTAELFETRSKRLARLLTGIAGSVGLVGLTMALIGLYAIVSYQVTRRTREIGIRMAIGAMQGQVLRMVLRQAATMGIAGVAIGTAISVAGGRGLAALAEAPLFDPLLMAAVPLVLLAAMFAASLIPARRAASIDPQKALRQD